MEIVQSSWLFAVISTPAHADSGGITLLQTFGYSGLELMLDDKWYQVPVIEDCLVVNVGEYMSRMSNNRFKATIHRVMDIGQDRYTQNAVLPYPNTKWHQ